MAYQVNKFNGTLIATVEDGTIDTTTDLRFVGKNYAGYGEVQNENFLHLLENFANNTAPPKKVTGQIWYDTSTKKLKFYDGSIFKVTSGAEASATAPSGLAIGDFWWDTTAKQLYSWSGTEYVLVGPASNPDLAASAVSPQVVKDTSNNNHGIIKFIAGGAIPKVVAIMSQTAFTLNSDINPIPNFTVIKKGITLANTNPTTGIGENDYTLWGTASSTTGMVDIDGVYHPESEYLKIGLANKDIGIGYSDPGFTVGDDNNLRTWIEGENAIIEHQLGDVNNITIRITVTPTTDERDIAIIDKDGITPGATDLYDLGTELSRWDNIYAKSAFFDNLSVANSLAGDTIGTHQGDVIAYDSTILVNATSKQIGYAGANLVGTLTGSCTGSSGSTISALQLTGLEPAELVPATSTATIPVRNASGNIYANQFIGTSDKSDRIRINNSAADPTWNTLTPSTQYRSAKTTATAYSIAARDSAGDLYAVLFQGTATAARYADLAEKYLADKEYEVGTVVAVGGEAEVTACESGDRAIGVVSANPAFMMNKDLEGGTYIALKGRVPCKVVGKIRKGDKLAAADNGCAAHSQGVDVFAIALDTSDDEGVKTVEVLVL